MMQNGNNANRMNIIIPGQQVQAQTPDRFSITGMN